MVVSRLRTFGDGQEAAVREALLVADVGDNQPRFSFGWLFESSCQTTQESVLRRFHCLAPPNFHHGADSVYPSFVCVDNVGVLLPVLSDLAKVLLPPSRHIVTLDHHRVYLAFLEDEADVVQEVEDFPGSKDGEMLTPPKFFCNHLCRRRLVAPEEIVHNVSQRALSEAVIFRSAASKGFTTGPFPRSAALTASCRRTNCVLNVETKNNATTVLLCRCFGVDGLFWRSELAPDNVRDDDSGGEETVTNATTG